MKAVIGIVMGSTSDWPTMVHAAEGYFELLRTQSALEVAQKSVDLYEDYTSEQQAAVDHTEADLTEAGEDFLLHLAGHARLLGTRVRRRVGVAVDRERPELGRALREPQAGAHPPVGGRDSVDDLLVLRSVERGPVELLHGEQKLRHHVPVHRADALVPVHAAGTSRE